MPNIKIDKQEYEDRALPTPRLEEPRNLDALNLAGGRLNRGEDVANYRIQSYIDEDQIVRVAYKFSTFVNSANAVSQDVTGFVHYFDQASSQENSVVLVDFYLEENLTVEELIIRQQFYNALDGATGTERRINDVSLYLNPEKNVKTSTNTGGNNAFYRYENGSLLVDKYDPTVDGDVQVYIATNTNINSLNYGAWNRVVTQQDTEDSGGTNYGYCVMDILINGYLTF